jgi:hypothetical protein
MRKLLLAAAACGALVQPAFAQSLWERLDHGFDVVRDCAGDVVQHCKAISPGGAASKPAWSAVSSNSRPPA